MGKFISGAILVVVFPLVLVLGMSVKTLWEFDDGAQIALCNTSTKKEFVMDPKGQVNFTYRKLTLDECRERVFVYRLNWSMLFALSLVAFIGVGIFYFSGDRG